MSWKMWMDGCGAKTLRSFRLNGLGLAQSVKRAPKRRGLDGGGTNLEQYFPEMEGSHKGNGKECTGVVILESQQNWVL